MIQSDVLDHCNIRERSFSCELKVKTPLNLNLVDL